MKGTILVASFEIRSIPPTTTTATKEAITTPMMSFTGKVVAMPMGSVNTVVMDSVSWLACITQKQPIIPKNAKKMARGLSFGLTPSVIMYIGPPLTLPFSSRPRYMMARVPSKNLVAIPSRALTHIQKMAPGPPMQMAIATPAMFPIPTVELIVVIRA